MGLLGLHTSCNVSKHTSCNASLCLSICNAKKDCCFKGGPTDVDNVGVARLNVASVACRGSRGLGMKFSFVTFGGLSIAVSNFCSRHASVLMDKSGTISSVFNLATPGVGGKIIGDCKMRADMH